MHSKILIAALAALMFSTGATMAIGKGDNSVAPGNILSDGLIFDAKEQASIVLAQNDKRTSEQNDQTESDSATGKSDEAEDDDKKSSEAESKPLKPFVPSEQIAGEQAVDFPADI